MQAQFVERYESIYGAGTAWHGSPVMLVDYEVIATIRGGGQPFQPWRTGTDTPACRSRREVFDPSTRANVAISVFDDVAIGVGANLTGPAIIDGKDTTIFVPAGMVATRHEIGDLRLVLTNGERT